MGSDVRDLVAAQYGKTSGMTAMRDYVDSIYRAFTISPGALSHPCVHLPLLHNQPFHNPFLYIIQYIFI